VSGGRPAPLAAAAALDYELPAERIAQEPLRRRDASRLLLVDAGGRLEDRRFSELPALLEPGDLCVVNDTRVRAARLRGRRPGGATAEVLVLRRSDGSGAEFDCLVRPARRIAVGEHLRFGAELEATVVGRAPGHPGARRLRFTTRSGDIDAAVERAGEAPLPPYIRRRLDEPERYQTVYARGAPESAAAPTAGLHFSERVIAALRRRGVGWASVRLEVGLPTFAPVADAPAPAGVPPPERYRVPEEAAAAVEAARSRGGRVVAVGTTVARTLETSALEHGAVRAGAGTTGLVLAPGHRFCAVDGLLTNFHQPRSSLLLLLSAFIGEERWRQAYAHALSSGYRFLSLGDCMLCWAAPGP
jgi:S-adenosylmethionine:tRNA ribosyltransferase-isomerase